MIILLASLSLSQSLHISTSPASFSLFSHPLSYVLLPSFLLSRASIFGEYQILLRTAYFIGKWERDPVSSSPSSSLPFWFVLNIKLKQIVLETMTIFFLKKNLISFHIALEKREAVCSFMWGHVSFKEAGMGMAFRETTAPFFPELPFPKPLLPQANLAQLSIPFHCSLYLYFTPRSLSFSPATGLFKKDENYWVLFRIGWCEKNIH